MSDPAACRSELQFSQTPLDDDLCELGVRTDGCRDSVSNAGVILSGSCDEVGYVHGGVLARCEHERVNDDRGGSRIDTASKAVGDCGFRKLHVRVFDDGVRWE